MIQIVIMNASADVTTNILKPCLFSPIWPELNQAGLLFWDFWGIFLLHPAVGDLLLVSTIVNECLGATHQREVPLHGANETLAILLGSNNRWFTLSSIPQQS